MPDSRAYPIAAGVAESLAELQAAGVPAVGLTGLDAGLVKATKRPPVPVVPDGATEPELVDFGLVGDIGCRSQLAWARLVELDLLLIETNHDLDMLREGPYPWPLKQRVAGRHGHLSNREAADGLPELVTERLRQVVLYHLSRTNNKPALAAATVAEALDRLGSAAAVVLSEQFAPTAWLEVTT